MTRTYGYDDADQLTNDTGTAYTYDANGNRTTAGSVTGPGNRLQSDGTWAYAYDDAGQVTGKSTPNQALSNTWAYEYDHRGQLVSATLTNHTVDQVGGPPSDAIEVAYAYDAFGNRIRRTESTYQDVSGGGKQDPDWQWVAVADARYAMDGWDPAKPEALGTEAFDVYADLDGSGSVTTRRVFGSGFDDLGARLTADGKVGWYATDGRGSVRAVFDNAGVAVEAAAYDAWGTFLGGVPVDRYAFTGREYDPTTGLQHNRGREYDAATGRWLSEDPIRDDYANAYRYVGNSPTNATDPSGLDTLRIVGTEVSFERYYRFALWSNGGVYHIGTLDEIEGVIYVRHGQYLVPLDLVRDAIERTFTVGYGGEWRADPNNITKWFRENDVSSEVLKKHDERKIADRMFGPAVITGAIAAALVRALISSVAETALIQAAEMYGPVKMGHFIEWAAKRGYKVWRNSKGEITHLTDACDNRLSNTHYDDLFARFGRTPLKHLGSLDIKDPQVVVQMVSSRRGWKEAGRTAGLEWNDSLIYVVRDKKTGELLKVGETQRWETRFGEYLTRAGRERREVEIYIWKIEPPDRITRINQYETPL